MTEIRHRAFVHQPNGFIIVSNGTDEVIYQSAADLRLDMPDYALPVGAVAVNFETRGGQDFLHVRMADGSVVVVDEIEDTVRTFYNGLIDSVATFKAAVTARAHPLYGVADDATARTIAKRLVAGEFERRAAELVAEYSLTERATWPAQLEEAQAVVKDTSAPAPMLEEIAVNGETKGDVAAKVLAKAASLRAAAVPLLAIKRHVFDEIEGRTASELQGFDAASAWMAAEAQKAAG